MEAIEQRNISKVGRSECRSWTHLNPLPPFDFSDSVDLLLNAEMNNGIYIC